MNGTSVLINFAIFQADAFEADRTKERFLSTPSTLRTLVRSNPGDSPYQATLLTKAGQTYKLKIGRPGSISIIVILRPTMPGSLFRHSI